jgi:hypothetical protein
VLIGAYSISTNTGAAYLFSINGTWLTSFTRPASPSFGVAVAAVGTDKVIIGADTDSIGGAYAGAAYLFSTNGALLTTFTAPTPHFWHIAFPPEDWSASSPDARTFNSG